MAATRFSKMRRFLLILRNFPVSQENPLGRRCPEGADEGAFKSGLK